MPAPVGEQRSANAGGRTCGDSTIPGAAYLEPSRDEVRAALERVLASSHFSRASQQSQFLRFVVQETLEGRGTDLKEYSIGTALKGPSFDGDMDTTIRVQAANIRRKLAQYYEGPGADARLIIEIPKPGYVPVFHYRPATGDITTGAAARLVKRPLALLLAGVGVVLTIAAVMVFRSRSPAGSVRDPLRLVQITYDAGRTGDAAVSRDGRLLVFTSDRAGPGCSDLWIRDLEGGEPRRLTHGAGIAQTPDIAPDSRSVVFRSFRDGGGIYVVPVSGGDERRIADGGFSPRFSPDGAWIAYTRIEQSGIGSVYIVPAQGGRPWRLQAQNMPCDCALWTPDGKAIQFVAKDDGPADWWLAQFDPAAGHPVTARKAGLVAALRRRGMDLPEYPCWRDWLNRDLVLASTGGLLRIGMNARDWSVQGPIAQVLPGVGIGALRVSREPSGRASLVYENSHNQTHIWAVPLAERFSESQGELRKLAEEEASPGFLGSRPSLSSDGRWLVFSNGADPATKVRLHDLRSGTATRLSPPGAFADRAVISRDGETVAYQQRTGGRRAIYAVRTAEPARVRRICADCGEPLSWSPNRERLLFLRDGGLWLLDVESGAARALIRPERYQVFQGSLSPEGRRIALVLGVPGRGKIQGVIARFDGNIGPGSSWTPIAEESYELSMEWAPEGDVIYYFNQRDGYRCLWGQKLDESGLGRAGEPFAVRHFHRVRQYPLYGSWIAPARDFIGVTLTESFANLYRIYLP